MNKNKKTVFAPIPRDNKVGRTTVLVRIKNLLARALVKMKVAIPEVLFIEKICDQALFSQNAAMGLWVEGSVDFAHSIEAEKRTTCLFPSLLPSTTSCHFACLKKK